MMKKKNKITISYLSEDYEWLEEEGKMVNVKDSSDIVYFEDIPDSVFSKIINELKEQGE